jgi:hypothetical protein
MEISGRQRGSHFAGDPADRTALNINPGSAQLRQSF